MGLSNVGRLNFVIEKKTYNRTIENYFAIRETNCRHRDAIFMKKI